MLRLFFFDNGAFTPRKMIQVCLFLMFLCMYCYTCIVTKEFIDIPTNWTLVLCGILGFSSIGNAVKALAERKNENGKTTTQAAHLPS